MNDISSDPLKTIRSLVEKFDLHYEQYKAHTYNETQVRREFIDPMFKALGWDIDNEQGYAEQYKDVIHEDAIKVGGATKAPDYCFRIGGVRKFFLEAKKPAVNLKDDPLPSLQLRRYAWSAKLPLSILTDFEEFIVFDTRVRPSQTDKSSQGRTICFQYTDYLDKWDEIASIFSREAILKGAFDKYAETTKKKRGTAEVDDVFLAEIEEWRTILAKNLALRNPNLSQRELNFAVQKIIDRIIFLRICEDRGIEPYGGLQALQNGVNVYPRLCEMFGKADDRYNSGLFHFNREKDRPGAPDNLTLKLQIDDKTLKSIFKQLYYPESPYEFSVLPADILGHIYERFLGSVIRLSKGHRAVVEQKPEVRKAGGVYYTPTYIVDYIVKHTVGELLKDKKPGPRGGASGLRILDPACGSGSFLLGAYQYLLDWHLAEYGKEPERWTKGSNPTIFEHKYKGWRLTTAEKKRILLNNIYGVDIDPQAVEVTKLSLLLKVLEDESAETIQQQLRLFHDRALPDLAGNIKCGNSLIGPDYYSGSQPGLFDEEEMYRINAFDWKAEFPEIMKDGGFDAVIGNPPYVRQETLGNLKEYFSNHYKVYHGIADLYAYFIERGVTLLNENGKFGYIVANKWMRANYGEPLRQWLKKQNIERILDFGDLPVFEKATTYPCILIISKDKPGKDFPVTQIKTLDFQDLDEYAEERAYNVGLSSLDDKGWSLSDERTQKLLDKLSKKGIPLGEYVDGKIYRGILTGLNKAFVIDEDTRKALIEEDPKSAELIKPFLAGRDIKRYQPLPKGKYLILIPKGWTNLNSGKEKNKWKWLKDNYHAIANHLESFSKDAEKRCDKGDYWWELRTCDYYDEFEKPKILWPEIAQNARFAFDNDNNFGNNKLFLIPRNDKYLLGLLNSKLLKLFIHSVCTDLQGNSYNFSYIFLKRIPIVKAEKADLKGYFNKVSNLVDSILKLNIELSLTNTDFEKAAVQRQIESTDKQIDKLVYALYGLTDEEIAIVEESFK